MVPTHPRWISAFKVRDQRCWCCNFCNFCKFCHFPPNPEHPEPQSVFAHLHLQEDAALLMEFCLLWRWVTLLNPSRSAEHTRGSLSWILSRTRCRIILVPKKREPLLSWAWLGVEWAQPQELQHSGNVHIPGYVQLIPTFRGKLSLTSSAFNFNRKDPEILPKTKLKTGENPKRKEAVGKLKIGQGRLGTAQSKGQSNQPWESKSKLSFQQNSTAPQNQGISSNICCTFQWLCSFPRKKKKKNQMLKAGRNISSSANQPFGLITHSS